MCFVRAGRAAAGGREGSSRGMRVGGCKTATSIAFKTARRAPMSALPTAACPTTWATSSQCGRVEGLPGGGGGQAMIAGAGGRDSRVAEPAGQRMLTRWAADGQSTWRSLGLGSHAALMQTVSPPPSLAGGGQPAGGQRRKVQQLVQCGRAGEHRGGRRQLQHGQQQTRLMQGWRRQGQQAERSRRATGRLPPSCACLLHSWRSVQVVVIDRAARRITARTTAGDESQHE